MDGELLELYNAGQAIVLEQRAARKAEEERTAKISEAKKKLVADKILQYVPEQLKEYINTTEISDASGTWNYIYIAYPVATEIRISLWVRFVPMKAGEEIPEISDPRTPVFQYRVYKYHPSQGLHDAPRIETGWSDGFQVNKLGELFYRACDQYQRLAGMEEQCKKELEEYKIRMSERLEEMEKEMEEDTTNTKPIENDITTYTDEYGRTATQVSDQFLERLRKYWEGNSGRNS